MDPYSSQPTGQGQTPNPAPVQPYPDPYAALQPPQPIAQPPQYPQAPVQPQSVAPGYQQPTGGAVQPGYPPTPQPAMPPQTVGQPDPVQMSNIPRLREQRGKIVTFATGEFPVRLVVTIVVSAIVIAGLSIVLWLLVRS